MATRTEQILAGVLIATIIIAVATILIISYRIPNVGRIKAIGLDVCWDENATQLVEAIDWGTLSPGDLAGTTVYMKNTRNVNFTMSFNTTNWNPLIANESLTFDWNYTGQVIQPTEVLPVQLTLYVDPSIVGITNFSFDINIRAIEVEA